VGVAPQQAAGVAQPDLGQRVHGAACLLDAWYPDAGEVLVPLPADGSHRIKCRGRFLRNESDAPPEQRAEVFGQASQAWTMAGRIGQAFASADQAVTLSPDDPDLRIGRAIAALAQHRFAEAADDLTRVLDGDPKRTDALVLRATANRNLGRLAQAAADVDAAAAQDADNPDALLERGIVRQRTGDLAGARADWERTADLGADTPTGDLAQQNLALLQAGPPQ